MVFFAGVVCELSEAKKKAAKYGIRTTPSFALAMLIDDFMGVVRGFRSPNETSTGALANCSRELANFKRELTDAKRKLADAKRKLGAFKPIIPGFDQLYPGSRRDDSQFYQQST